MAIPKFFDDFFLDYTDESDILIIHYHHETWDGNEINDRTIKKFMDDRFQNDLRTVETGVKDLKSGKAERDNLVSLGKLLYEMLFPGEVNNAFGHAMDLLENDQEQDRGLRIVIGYSAKSDRLAQLPFELLHTPGDPGIWLGTDPRFSLSRKFTQEGGKVRLYEKRPPLKILLVVGNALDMPPVVTGDVLKSLVDWAASERVEKRDVDYSGSHSPRQSSLMERVYEESAEIKLKVLGLVHEADFPTESLGSAYLCRPASLDEFEQIVGTWKPQVIHFICHGGNDTNEGQIGFINQITNNVEFISANELAYCLQPVKQWLRLVVMQTCESASSQRSLASQLVKLEIPAVIAMQFEIENQYAVTFAKAFYEALARKIDVDYAVQMARKGITAMYDPLSQKKISYNRREFCTPALYSVKPGITIIDNASEASISKGKLGDREISREEEIQRLKDDLEKMQNKLRRLLDDDLTTGQFSGRSTSPSGPAPSIPPSPKKS